MGTELLELYAWSVVATAV